jgi:hypothetical protein
MYQSTFSQTSGRTTAQSGIAYPSQIDDGFTVQGRNFSRFERKKQIEYICKIQSDNCRDMSLPREKPECLFIDRSFRVPDLLRANFVQTAKHRARLYLLVDRTDHKSPFMFSNTVSKPYAQASNRYSLTLLRHLRPGGKQVPLLGVRPDGFVVSNFPNPL